MTTLIWKGKIIDDVYLFTSHKKSWYETSGWDEEDALDYRCELDDLKEGCQEILVENEKLYENFCENGNNPEDWDNKWIDREEIEGFLEEFCWEKKEIMETCKREYSMFYQGELLVDGVTWEDEPPYRSNLDLFTSTYESIGYDNWERYKYQNEYQECGATILQYRYFADTTFQLEIDGDFVREKLKYNKETMRVEYDGKEFNLLERGAPRREDNTYEMFAKHNGYNEIVPQSFLG